MSTSSSDDDWSTIQTEAHDDPPPYDDVEASHRLFGTIQTVVNSERGEDDDPVETENMRKFLLYCLSVDYRYAGDYEIPASEREKYAEMWVNMFKIRYSQTRTHITEYERCILGPYFWKYLHKPCQRLSIPVECAIKAIERFFKYTSSSNRYKGCVYGLIHHNGPEVLARKLWQDRNLLIPQLAETEQARHGLTTCLTDFARQYFVTIDGVSSTIAADSSQGWSQDTKISYSLTARGTSYGLLRNGTIVASLCDYARSSWRTIQSCMDDLSNRVSMFPQGKIVSDDRATWDGPDTETTGQPSEEGLRSTLRGWGWHEDCHLPDCFEHRPGRNRCDL